MTEPLPQDQLVKIIPLLRHIAEMVKKTGPLNHKGINLLLMGSGISESWALDEIDQWAKILNTVVYSIDMDELEFAKRALMLRGIPEANCSLAIGTVAGKSDQLSVSVDSIDLGTLPYGQEGHFEFEIHGGPGRVECENEHVSIIPPDFRSTNQKIRVNINPLLDGVLFSEINIISVGGTTKIPISARWLSKSENIFDSKEVTTSDLPAQKTHSLLNREIEEGSSNIRTKDRQPMHQTTKHQLYSPYESLQPINPDTAKGLGRLGFLGIPQLNIVVYDYIENLVFIITNWAIEVRNTHSLELIQVIPVNLESYKMFHWHLSYNDLSLYAAYLDVNKSIRVLNVRDGQILSVIPTEEEYITCCQFNHANQLLAIGKKDGQVLVYDVITGVLKYNLGNHHFSVTGLSFSPDDLILASSSVDMTIRLWDTEKGEYLRGWYEDDGEPEQEKIKINGRPVEIAFAHDGATLASIFIQDKKIWDVKSESPTQHSENDYINFGLDGYYYTSTNEIQKSWDEIKNSIANILQGHKQVITDLAYNPNKGLMASSSEGRLGKIRLWDVWERRLMRVWEDHKGNVTSIKFTADGLLLGSASTDKTVHLYRISNGKREHILKGAASKNYRSFYPLATSPVNPILASFTEYDSINLWDSDTGELVRVIKDQTNHLAISQNGQLLASCPHKTIKLWEIETGSCVKIITLPNIATNFVFQNNETLLIASKEGLFQWQIASNKLIEIHQNSIMDMSLSPDQSMLVTIGDTIQLIDLKSKQFELIFESENMEIIHYPENLHPVRTTFSHDQMFIVMGWNNGDIWLWGSIALENENDGINH